ncbi:MAG: hypothetical protein COV46_03880 [Deltaproteobacteria bacterium CG11_big_fil_rev_8_21_14_0_20_49_13]|nr:MAG: hypothetical protein COV46_03880 [Deltaproteobacteria bacterium CG11_big_fil_rev_8_21_14_0_20_49_13]
MMPDKKLSTDMLSLARLIRDIDDDLPEARSELKRLAKYSGSSYIIGVTGSPGAGKSTLIAALITKLRKEGKTVGVIAVDPTSPFSGGAVLGDRIRMKEHNNDEGVFIKSVATRGAMGGLSRSVADIALALEASGKDVIIMETVGVGQDEVEVFRVASHVLVVTSPGFGDEIQAIKAGVLEIADTLVVNKCDLPGAEKVVQELKEGTDKEVIATDAIRGTGIDSLYEKLIRGSDAREERKKGAKRGAKLEKGLVQVYTGEGKGKTTASLGLALRASGHGLKGFIIQFMKGNIEYGELEAAKRLAPNLTIKQMGRESFVDKENPDPVDIQMAGDALKLAFDLVKDASIDLLVLDEINVALDFKLVKLFDVLKLIDAKPQTMELILTGRYAPKEIIERADLVTEMKEIKHYYKNGIDARVGIER